MAASTPTMEEMFQLMLTLQQTIINGYTTATNTRLDSLVERFQAIELAQSLMVYPSQSQPQGLNPMNSGIHDSVDNYHYYRRISQPDNTIKQLNFAPCHINTTHMVAVYLLYSRFIAKKSSTSPANEYTPIVVFISRGSRRLLCDESTIEQVDCDHLGHGLSTTAVTIRLLNKHLRKMLINRKLGQ